MPPLRTVLGSVALGALALGALPATAAPKGRPAPTIDDGLMRRVIATLASDAMEGRGPATAAEPYVLDYIIAQFKAAGLKPGNRGEWLQPVPTVSITGSQFSPLTVTGGSAALSFQPVKDFVAFSYRAVPETAITDAELVFVGYGIRAPELGWDDYAGVDVKGKVVVVLVNDPDYAASDETGLFKGRRMTWYGRWPYKYEEAARQGARGVLIVHDTYPAAYGWNVIESTSTRNFIQTPNRGMDQTEANGWIQKPAAEKIFAAAGHDFAALSAAAARPGFKAVPLGLKASYSFRNQVKTSVSHNVVGLLPGKGAPDEVVLYSAHWDHLGRCKPDATGDDICNGAVDNATGVAGIVALAQAQSQAGPARRSQAFIALTLEESGLLGSEYYAANPVFPLARTVGGVNLDGLAPGGRSRDMTMSGGDKSELNTLFRKHLAALGLRESPESNPERGGYYRSDHFSFAKRGVPVYSFGRGNDLEVGGTAAGQAAAEDYTRNRYHQPNDHYSADWDMSGIVQEVSLAYRLGRELADGTGWPNWLPTDEFRAIRDASRTAAAAPAKPAKPAK
ncbi:M28 family peptidase [Novosphingobium piscinae]|uniref:M28 family peptidase n=1 Tax=Novosphingobium piscinae TaxID=1507448 RepID=A0A7X1G0C8_9SPHN|nr:M28 family peptidase [Novosphingobium piscinae]MBC2670324.1 M28 family peptidase [Novosphingobium piscinae]